MDDQNVCFSSNLFFNQINFLDMTEIEKIEKVCSEMGINEKEMCKEIGINYSTLWRYYNGKFKNHSYSTMVKLMAYVGLIK